MCLVVSLSFCFLICMDVLLDLSLFFLNCETFEIGAVASTHNFFITTSDSGRKSVLALMVVVFYSFRLDITVI